VTEAGYSGTPLLKKLGIKADFTVRVVNQPDNYFDLLAPITVEGLVFLHSLQPELDLVHLFTNSRDELMEELSLNRNLIKPEGSIWVSWYKKAAKLPTEITEDTIREAALPMGLVDVKVCAVDEKWSGLKLVIRKENRQE
jgi:hypothetical protein